MSLSTEEEMAMEPAQRVVVLRAEMEGRLAALEGGSEWKHHGNELKWLAAEIWRLERILKPKATP